MLSLRTSRTRRGQPCWFAEKAWTWRSIDYGNLPKSAMYFPTQELSWHPSGSLQDSWNFSTDCFFGRNEPGVVDHGAVWRNTELTEGYYSFYFHASWSPLSWIGYAGQRRMHKRMTLLLKLCWSCSEFTLCIGGKGIFEKLEQRVNNIHISGGLDRSNFDILLACIQHVSTSQSTRFCRTVWD